VYHVYLAIEHISKHVTITEDAVTIYSGIHNYPEWQKELRTKYKTTNIDDIITEIIATKTSERGETRIDDKVSEAAMEDRKKSGYF
jgi:3'-phosphoadenosine 5'-phosphosulfate sulfotransferase (PAPS reductase)/FAD synthetase